MYEMAKKLSCENSSRYEKFGQQSTDCNKDFLNRIPGLKPKGLPNQN